MFPSKIPAIMTGQLFRSGGGVFFLGFAEYDTFGFAPLNVTTDDGQEALDVKIPGDDFLAAQADRWIYLSLN
jgi:hypothetical protein